MSNQPVLEILGGYPLSGHVQISGAKNSALAIMAGALLCSEDCHLRNIPNLADISKMCQILTDLGVKIERHGHELVMDTKDINQSNAPYELVSQMRASFFVIGPILARLGFAEIPLPGGCAIGARPVELHVSGLQAMGASVQIEHGVVHAQVRGRLKGANIHLDYPSVGATETIMMAATLADGETVIDNAAQEPEVVDLANFCRAMGAKITGAGTKRIVIYGVDRLHAVDYEIIPDRIEAGTFLVAGAITRSRISLSPVVPDHLGAVLSKLENMGVTVIADGPKTLTVLKGNQLKAVDIETQPYPGFPTDMQAQFMALQAISEGDSVTTETVFENRLRHVAELNRLGADIRTKGNIAIVRGVLKLSGAPVESTDLRAAAALVVAGLAAEGKTTVQALHHLDRGYENIEAKLQQLGARITRTGSVQAAQVT
jgi:UDP-N-acetylglucosamine 1-carboxyvinyltransferase